MNLYGGSKKRNVNIYKKFKNIMNKNCMEILKRLLIYENNDI